MKTTQPNDGGPAFPRDTKWMMDGSIMQQGSSGMTLRDWFAGMALQGWLSGPCQGDVLDEYADTPEAFREHQQKVAEACYCYADAMIAERNQ